MTPPSSNRTEPRSWHSPIAWSATRRSPAGLQRRGWGPNGPPAIVRPLGYPDYFRSLLGVAKVLGALALLLPRPSILREWAYAGFTFDLLGAFASHALHGDAAAHLAPALIALGLLVASYVLRRRAHSEGGGR